MITLYLNREIADDGRRESLFAGNFYLYTNLPGAHALADHAKSLIAEAFSGRDPERAQYEMPVDEFVELVGPLKAEFTNGQRTKELCQQFALDLGVDPENTYFDIPRLRVIPADNYLSAGVSYNYKAHRDMWYGHPQQLVNYWVPVFPVVGDNVMSMFTDYFDKPIKNGSNAYDYDEWVAKHRPAATEKITTDDRPHPLPLEEIDSRGEIRIAGGSGDVMMFSSNHLHASAPNLSGVTRFSYDLRTINLEDIRAGRGPRNVDCGATGTTLGDFLRVGDLAPLPADEFAAALQNS
ncbi:hypothetical protein [Pseudonocardia asaccharolytica]|uniref:Phytanoyl-CoA dioxygenase n=1 Tax=Pseudonocardia asaccharolytica DSM 44247 = NBRC 16224 TaxID=1123024 RepID=A0A511D658_9PSEU|nr:hypothetical protein [Pseudonocardia asaccharolytica]GEL20276.1 hypothetical protein PA7_41130 [Pseudonocardia asaccharolytica DSM 44247 = NBRC 16224]